MSGSSTLLQPARLRERTSGKGTRYMSGRLGGVKVVILPTRDYAEGDSVNSHTHILYFQDGSATGPRPAAAPAERERPRKVDCPADRQQMEDDPVPF